MDLLDLAEKRYSVRTYKSTPIEDEKLEYILEAVRVAPTGGKQQDFQSVIAHTKGREYEFLQPYTSIH